MSPRKNRSASRPAGARVPARRLSKGELLARMPAALRPKLSPDELQQLRICHVINLHAVARGEAGEPMLWDYYGSVLLWAYVARRLQAGVPEIQQQLELCERMAERYGRTGRVRFDGADYQLAKGGVDAMDQLAELVDPYTAAEASHWSIEQINHIAAQVRAIRAAEATTPAHLTEETPA